jgi:hypothetical protein
MTRGGPHDGSAATELQRVRTARVVRAGSGRVLSDLPRQLNIR